MTSPTLDPRIPKGAVYLAQRARLLELLRAHSVREGNVTLASGKRSDFYVDCKQTTLLAEGHFLTGQLLRPIVDAVAPDAEAVGGLTLGADPLASAVSLMSFVAGKPLGAFIIRKEAKGHGTGAWLEGAGWLPDGAPIALLEDVVTTGGSTLEAARRAREAKLSVRAVIALVDRQEGGRQAIEREFSFVPLFTRADFST